MCIRDSARYVRRSQAPLWGRVLEAGADLSARVLSFGVLEWMDVRLRTQVHSRGGRRCIQQLLVERGAVAEQPLRWSLGKRQPWPEEMDDDGELDGHSWAHAQESADSGDGESSDHGADTQSFESGDFTDDTSAGSDIPDDDGFDG
eukprot:6515674-Prymnesium_polylepis.2